MNFLKPETTNRIEQLLFQNWTHTLEEQFLRKELERYVPELTRETDQHIQQFSQYQRAIYLNHQTPIIGQALACLNPTFTDNSKDIKLSTKNQRIWTIASKKENGYRMQLHIGKHQTPPATHPHASAITRQFTPYDLRLFPELTTTFTHLPVMIGDCELINKNYEHLAGFNRVQKRLPNATFWPTRTERKLDDELLQTYFNNNRLFNQNHTPQDEYQLTLSFHSLFAIADPNTWTQSRETQQANLISLSTIPKNYKAVDELLTELDQHIKKADLNARVTERTRIKSKRDLQLYIKKSEKLGLEGVCVSQYITPNKNTSIQDTISISKTTKIKNYETIDAALLGLYLTNPSEPATSQNMQGALLGLYDQTTNTYVPAFKVNLDSNGVQIKTQGQKDRLDDLRTEIATAIEHTPILHTNITTLHDIYSHHATIHLRQTIPALAEYDLQTFMQEIPRGQSVLSLYSRYNDQPDAYYPTAKHKTIRDEFIQTHKLLFQQIRQATKEDPHATQDLITYLSKNKDVKDKSNTLPKPHLLVNTQTPIILEAQVFDIKYNLNPFAAGFNPTTAQSFHLSNAFAERIRYDKATTTDYQTIDKIASKNTI